MGSRLFRDTTALVDGPRSALFSNKEQATKGKEGVVTRGKEARKEFVHELHPRIAKAQEGSLSPEPDRSVMIPLVRGTETCLGGRPLPQTRKAWLRFHDLPTDCSGNSPWKPLGDVT